MAVGMVLMVCRKLLAKVEWLGGMYFLVGGVGWTQKRNASELE